MLILADENIRKLRWDWAALVDVIEETARIMDAGDFAQPIKPYLRYGDPQNRIIAMPAYVGGSVRTAGIKWIASFPGNRRHGLPRAHGVTVLNDAETGEVRAILAGGMPNALRTAAVRGLLLRRFAEDCRPDGTFRIGIIGWGPIGRTHFAMCTHLFGHRIERFSLYDLAGIDPASVPAEWRSRTRLASGWEEVFDESGILFTCTVSKTRYIRKPPAPGMLLMDVSLRDYWPEAFQEMPAVIVDDWEEVCRENTDIEMLHLTRGLRKEETMTLADAVCRGALRRVPAGKPVLFCPMGMAAFDIAVARYLADLARDAGIGTEI